MHASLPSFDRRGLRLSSLALASAALLGACDNDRPVGPNAAATPDAANPVLVAKGGTLVIKIVDQNNQAPTTLGAQFTVASSGGPAYFAVDNSPNDGDPAIGVIQMKGLVGTYNVCQTVAPTDYVPADPPCQSVNMALATVAKLQFVNLTVGHLAWEVTLKYGLQPVGYLGGSTWLGFDGLASNDTIVDNSAMDLDPTPGKLEIKVPSGSYNLCPLWLPKTYVWLGAIGANHGCIGLPVPPGQTISLGAYSAVPEYSTFWSVQDLSTGQFVGPSSYEIKGGASGNVFLTVDDQGQGDLDPAAGMVWAQFPEDGDYEICQTVAPPKMQLASPSCAKVTVTLGMPAWTAFQSWPL